MDPSGRHGQKAAKPAQKQAQRPQSMAQQSQTATKRTLQRIVAGPNGKPVQVVETEEHIVKKTMWTRVLTGTKNAAKPSTWKQSGKAVKKLIPQSGKAVTNLIPHSVKLGKNSSGFNMSYYRKTFFLLDRQTQFDLYEAGLAPKMTKLEISKLHAATRGYRIRRKFKRTSVMYDAHISPSGYEASPRDLVKEARDAKEAAANKKEQPHTATTANPDALPVHPTPANYTKTQVQTRPTKTQQQQAHLQQQQKLKQQPHQQQRLSQHRAQTTTATSTHPQRHSQQIGLAIPHPPPQRQTETHHTAGAAAQGQRRTAQQQRKEQQQQQQMSASQAQAQGMISGQHGLRHSQVQGQGQGQGHARARQSVGLYGMAGRVATGRSVARQSVAGSSRG